MTDSKTMGTRIGTVLDTRGKLTDRPLTYRWAPDSTGLLIAGACASGKTVLARQIAQAMLEHDCTLALCSSQGKQVEWEFARDYRNPYWGAGPDDVNRALHTLIAEQEHRLDTLVDYHVGGWQYLPDEVHDRMPRILLVCDDMADYMAPVDIPRLIPIRMLGREARRQHVREDNRRTLRRITAAARFTGIHVICLAQQVREQAGMPVDLHTLFDSKILLGASSDDQVRDMFASSAPIVPTALDKVKQYKYYGVASLHDSAPLLFATDKFTADPTFDYQHVRRQYGELVRKLAQPTMFTEHAEHDREQAQAAGENAMRDLDQTIINMVCGWQARNQIAQIIHNAATGSQYTDRDAANDISELLSGMIASGPHELPDTLDDKPDLLETLRF